MNVFDSKHVNISLWKNEEIKYCFVLLYSEWLYWLIHYSPLTIGPFCLSGLASSPILGPKENFHWATHIYELKKEYMSLSILEAWSKTIFSFVECFFIHFRWRFLLVESRCKWVQIFLGSLRLVFHSSEKSSLR